VYCAGAEFQLRDEELWEMPGDHEGQLSVFLWVYADRGGCFVFFPVELLRIFSDSSEVIAIGKTAFPIIGSSFIPAVFSLMTPVFFQAIGNGRVSLFLSVMRQIFCLIPIFWALSLLGLQFTWFAFPISEVLVGVTGMGVYWRTINGWKNSRK